MKMLKQFGDDGSLDTGDLITSNDDNGSTFGGDVTVQNVSVPAPATFLLLCLGLAGLGASRRKKA